MRPQLPEHAVATLLRQCFTTPRCQLSPHSLPKSRILPRKTRSILEEQRRCYQTPAETHPLPPTLQFRAHRSNLEHSREKTISGHGDGDGERIAVLGAGITGLASAHYLALELPHAKITVYEGSERIGGWLKTEQFGNEDGKIFFEQGPRTLRPGGLTSVAGLAMLELVQDLGLEEELLVTPKTSAAAQNRFVYYPDHLVKMPGPGQGFFEILGNVFREPVFEDLPIAVGGEFFTNCRDLSLEDESVGSFINRRLNTTKIADNIASAVLHGIYAGDIYKLSIKSLLPSLWQLEAMHGSLVGGTYQLNSKGVHLIRHPDLQLAGELGRKLNRSLLSKMDNASVYTFKNGLGALSMALENKLKDNPNVEFKMNSKVSSVEHDGESDQITIKTSENSSPPTYTRVISTIPGRTLSTLSTHTATDNLQNNTVQVTDLPSLASIHAVTVMVVNLFYADPALLPAQGFGYLIPRSIPYEQNPERALGVIFDTDAAKDLDTLIGTKVTVMIGGHWWDDFDSYPSEEEGIAMARAVLKRHLNVTAEPILTKAGLQRDCIPQYTVGHEGRMKKAHTEVRNAFGGKLAVAGNSYTGVGVNDCVRAARDVVMAVARGKDVTGLEEFNTPVAWVEISKDARI